MRDRDRYAMSQVCKFWSEAFHSARLWRERSYRFAGVYTNIKLGEKALAFAKKHSMHLKVSSLICLPVLAHSQIASQTLVSGRSMSLVVSSLALEFYLVILRMRS